MLRQISIRLWRLRRRHGRVLLGVASAAAVVSGLASLSSGDRGSRRGRNLRSEVCRGAKRAMRETNTPEKTAKRVIADVCKRDPVYASPLPGQRLPGQDAPSGPQDGEVVPSVVSVKTCLQRMGLRVDGKPDTQPVPSYDASDHGELYVETSMLYFYSSRARAAKLGVLLADYVGDANRRESAKEHLTLVRRDSVRVVEYNASKRAIIDGCLRNAAPWKGR